MTDKETIVLVDGSSLAFRSFYAMITSGLRTKTGVPTWAILGFFNSLLDLIDRQKPHMLAVCFDLSAPTFRHEQFEDYKANRQEMPDDLAIQWPLIKQGVEVLGIPLLELAGYEADDVIGTVAKKAAAEGREVLILTGDQDAFQLLDDDSGRIKVIMPRKEGLKVFTRAEVFEKLGVQPEQVIDYKGLCGDTSDNIPGVKGIGPKTAQKLLAEYGTLEKVYENLDNIKSASVRKKLEEGKESAFTSQHLATIVLDAPVPFDFEQCRLGAPDVEAVAAFFKRMQFRSLVDRLPRALAEMSGADDLESTESDFKSKFKGIDVAPITLDEASSMGGSPPERSDAGGKEAERVAKATATATAVLEPEAEPIRVPRIDAPPTPLIVSTEEQLDELVAALSAAPVFAVDLETTGLNSVDTSIVGWAFSWGDGLDVENGRLVASSVNGNAKSEFMTAYIPVRHQVISYIRQLEPEFVAEKLKPILENEKIGKIAQNAKFEINVMSLIDIELKGLMFDTMLASYIVNPDDKHGLKDQCERILDYSMQRITEIIGTGRKQINMSEAPIERVAPYAADDARITMELARYYAQKLDDEQSYLMYKMELPLCVVLATMEQNGVALDREYLRQFSSELHEELTRVEGEIFELAGYTFNINSTQQLQKVLFEELGLQPKGKTKTGYSTDASVLESLITEHAIVSKILEYRHISKLRSTYVDALPREVIERDGRLHGEFNQTVASTGRLSSSNPNLQNIPIRTEIGRRIRRAFTAAEGSSILSADYSQIELRMLAHMSGDETLIDAFEKNQDIHARTAGEIFDVPLEEVDADKRRVGKTLNFALVYQQGAFATAQDLGISTKEAQEFIDKYFSRYPKVKAFLEGTIEEAKANNYVTTLWGRRRYFLHLHDRNANIRRADERAACNAPIQGSAADLMKLAMIDLDGKLKESGTRAKLVLQVHDELVLEVPDSELDQVKRMVKEAMEQDQQLKVPLKVDFGVGKNWMDAK